LWSLICFSPLLFQATFLAAVQAQISAHSLSQNDTTLQIVINAFFFVGLLLDLIAGCGAFIAFRLIQRYYSLLLQRSVALNTIREVMAKPDERVERGKGVQKMDMIFLHGFRYAHESWSTIRDKTQKFEQRLDDAIDKDTQWQLGIFVRNQRSTTAQLIKMRRLTLAALKAAYVLPAVAGTGTMCLVVGLLSFIRATQPYAIWVCSMVVTVCTIILLLALTLRRP
jgi:hypothetical protein